MTDVAYAVARRVLDEEIEVHGSWWGTENSWVVVRGKGKDSSPVDEITPALEATSQRTGLSMERLTEIFRLSHPLVQRGAYLTTTQGHHDRRVADGTLERIDRALKPHPNLFEVWQPVPKEPPIPPCPICHQPFKLCDDCHPRPEGDC